MKTIATYSIKGGVGKTATAVNLACLAAREGKRTLVWDLDPQGAATFYFRIKPRVKGGAKGVLAKNGTLGRRIRGTDYEDLDLLPADFSYRHMDIALDDAKKPTGRLRKILKPLATEYDLVVLDCPPSISLVSEAVFRAADALLVPVIPTTLSVRTLEQLAAFRADQDLDELALLPFFSMVDRRKRLHRDLADTLPERFPEILSTRVPYASVVERMGVERAPVAAYARNHPAARAYEALWAEVKGRLDGG